MRRRTDRSLRAATLPAWSKLLLATAAALLAWPCAAQLRAPATTQSVGNSPPARVATPSTALRGDYILAVVNQELVTAAELALRIQRVRDAASRAGNALPPEPELRSQVLKALIDERVLVTAARETGQRVDEAEIDRAVANVAGQNQISEVQLRARLQAEGVDYGRFRNNLRDQLLVERTREREVQSRIRITDAEIDAEIARQHAAAGNATEYNIAQILVAVPEGASAAQVMERRMRADSILARVRAGENFEAVARSMSDDSNKEQGGVIGMRPADRLPDVFVSKVKDLQVGAITPELLRSAAGFHVLKLLERRDAAAFRVTQTRVRHILLRPSAQLSEEAAIRRLAGFKSQIAAGTASFEDLARQNSEDGSAAAGGDLGWMSPGSLVPEFEQAMDELKPGGLSDPIVSRFGVHLIQVLDRRELELDSRQQREQARNALKERKYEAAYQDWLDELRSRAYIEMREPPTS
ncbi:MAG: peptidylprolyl isomerase [Ideonella sp.]